MNIIRSATFEGMADKNGFPTEEYITLYETLAKNQVKTIITGFMFISDSGRAMQPGQAGIDSMEKAEAYKSVTAAVHRHGSKIIAQIAHAGRQTRNTGFEAVGVSAKKSSYFATAPRVLTTKGIYEIIDQFAMAAYYAKIAGFDGVQLHAAHGYLIHQFMLRSINNRTDEFSGGTVFLERIIEKIREKCGGFPIWVKVSGGVDIERYSKKQFLALIKLLDRLKIDFIEVSYGTMDYALNIIRGNVPIRAVFKHNPIYKEKSLLWRFFVLPAVRMKLKPSTPMYNLKYAKLAKDNTGIPVSVVGGFRSSQEIRNCGMDYVSLSRPFICEPDFMMKLNENERYRAKCTSCNLCTVMTDTKYSLKCFGGNQNDRKNH